MVDNGRKTSEADQVEIGNLWNAYTSSQPFQYAEGHGLANTRHFPPERYEFPQNFLTHEHSFIMDKQQFNMGKWPVQNSSGNTYSDFGPRFQEYLNDQHQFLRSMNIIGGNMVYPNAPNSSLNTSRTLPTIDERKNQMTDEENFVVLGRQRLVTGTWPVQDSSSNSSDYEPRVHESTKLQEAIPFEDQHQSLQRGDTRSGYMNSEPYHSPPNTRQILSTRDGWKYGVPMEENNLFMSRQLGAWPAQGSRSNVSNYGQRVHESTKVQEMKPLEDQNQYLQRGDTRSGYIMNSEPYHSSPKTRKILPAREVWQYTMPVEEHNLFMSGQQLGMSTWPAQDLSSNSSNYGHRVHESTNVQEIKPMVDQNKFFQRRDTRSGYIMHSDAYDSSPNTRQVLPGCENRMTVEEYNLFIYEQQLRMRTFPSQDFSRNAYSDIAPRVHENPKGQDTKLNGDQHQFLGHSDSVRGGDMIDPNIQYLFPNTKQILPQTDEWQHCEREEVHNSVKARRQLRMKTWPARDSTSAQSDLRSSVCENPPKEQEIKFNEDLRRRKTRDKKVKNRKDNLTDGTSRNSILSQEPNPLEWFESLHKIGITEDSWILLYTKGKATCVGLFWVIYFLLSIAVIKFGILDSLFLESLESS